MTGSAATPRGLKSKADVVDSPRVVSHVGFRVDGSRARKVGFYDQQ